MGTAKTGEHARSTPIMVRVPPEMRAQLEALARREASSMATVLRRLARERLEQLEQLEQQQAGQGGNERWD